MPPSVEEIASNVRLKAEHQLAERRLTELRVRRDKLREDFTALRASGADERDLKIAARTFDTETAELESAICKTREELKPLHAAHCERVAQAIQDRHVAAGEGIVAAIDALVAAVAEFNACQRELRRWGDEASLLFLPSLDAIRRFAAGDR